MTDQRQQQKEAARVGRSTAILFDYDYKGQCFDLVCRALYEKFYDHSPENTKKNFILSEKIKMGKSLFWACVHLICRKKNIINNSPKNHNLEPFVEHLHLLLGREHVGDRTVISRKINQLTDNNAHTNFPIETFSFSKREQIEKHRRVFRIVEKCWDEEFEKLEKTESDGHLN